MILRKNFSVILILPLFFNFIFNFFTNKIYLNLLGADFINLGSTLLLFLFLYFLGKAIKQTFKLHMISTGILFYFSSIFLFDNIFLFFTKNYSFSLIFLIFNFILAGYLIYKKRAPKELLSLSAIYLVNFLFNKGFSNLFNLEIPVKGDVEVQWYPMAKNIYNENYFYSLSNPFLDGYGQLISYTHAVLLKINFNLSDFEFLRSTTNVLFFLGILLLFELDIKNKHKILSMLAFAVLILNSEWLNYLFIDSLMGEGVVSYFFAVGVLSLFKEVKSLNQNNLTVYIIFGTIYFTKQFITLMVLIICISLLIYKNTRRYAFFSFIPLLINEINLITTLKNGKRDAYASNFDFKDTILDLLTNTNLKIENAYTIFSNLLKDRPFTYLLLLFIFSFLLIAKKRKKFDQEFLTVFCLFFLNLILIFTLYISAWRNMPELESPIRYIFNFFHIIIAYTFINLNDFEFSDN